MVRITEGEAAPDFSGLCSDGATRAVADHRPGNLLLVFLRHLG